MMIVCIGEILVDMIGVKKEGVDSFSRYVGGAPFNVASDLKKLGAKVGFCGRVGEDLMGDFLVENAQKYSFDSLVLQRDNRHNTTLAFVALDENGERKFSFHRKGTADYFLQTEGMEELIAKADIVHLGSLMLSEEEGRKIADEVIALAKKLGKKLSFDVNYREDIFESGILAKEVYAHYIKQADIVKFSEDEVELFVGSRQAKDIEKILKKGAVGFVTLGSKGSFASYMGNSYAAESIQVNCVDTTGAGDGFFAGALSVLAEASEYTADVLYRALRVGNICGALVTTKYGAIHDGLHREGVDGLLKIE